MCGAMSIHTQTFIGPAIAEHLPALARLRIEVFREWPYLYEGNEAEEQTHLAAFQSSPDAALVVAFHSDEPVGCSTCLPLAYESEHIRAPFEARGWDVRRFCYFGESVLRNTYRGQGIGVAFFAAREAHARTLPGVDFACFCGVRRDEADRRKPENFVKLDAFWRHRGYAPLEGIACIMTWPELGSSERVAHTLDFWAKPLTGAALP